MALQRKNKILEVSIESDAFYRTDNYMNAKHESQPHSLIFHNIHNPEWAARALRNIRHVKHIIDTGESAISESASLYVVKVLYDSDAISHHETDKFNTFKRMVKNAIESTIGHRTHL